MGQQDDYTFDYPQFMTGVAIFLAVVCIGAGLFFLVEYENQQTAGVVFLCAGFFNLLFSALLTVLREIRDNHNKP